MQLGHIQEALEAYSSPSSPGARQKSALGINRELMRSPAMVVKTWSKVVIGTAPVHTVLVFPLIVWGILRQWRGGNARHGLAGRKRVPAGAPRLLRAVWARRRTAS